MCKIDPGVDGLRPESLLWALLALCKCALMLYKIDTIVVQILCDVHTFSLLNKLFFVFLKEDFCTLRSIRTSLEMLMMLGERLGQPIQMQEK